MHLFRFLPLRLTLPWARELDRYLVIWLEQLLRLPLRAQPATWVLLTTPSRAGLGLIPLVIDALFKLHCLSGLIALTAAGEHPMTAEEPAEAECARTSLLLGLSGVDALRVGPDFLPHHRPTKLRQIVYEGLAARVLDQCPWLVPPPLDADTKCAGVSVTFQHRICLAWLTAPATYLLPAGPAPRCCPCSCPHPWP